MPNIAGEWGFTGSQTKRPAIQIDEAMLELEYGGIPSGFRHGDCIGADAQMHTRILISRIFRNTHITIHPPVISTKRAWCKGPFDRVTILEPKAYIPRNHDIVDNTVGLVACPKTYMEELRSGTWATIRYARKLSRPIIIVWPDGSVSYERYAP